jgi:hypothetical protein
MPRTLRKKSPDQKLTLMHLLEWQMSEQQYTKCRGGYGATVTLIHCWYGCKNGTDIIKDSLAGFLQS